MSTIKAQILTLATVGALIFYDHKEDKIIRSTESVDFYPISSKIVENIREVVDDDQRLNLDVRYLGKEPNLESTDRKYFETGIILYTISTEIEEEKIHDAINLIKLAIADYCSEYNFFAELNLEVS